MVDASGGTPAEDPAERLAQPEITPSDAGSAPATRRDGLSGLAGTVRDAIGMVNDAAPRTLRIAIALEVLTAALTAAQLYVIKGLVVDLLKVAGKDGQSVSAVVPVFIGLLVVTLAMGIAAAVLAAQQQLLSELVGRHTLDRVVDVSSVVELARLEQSDFYDRLERATRAATFRPIDIVNALLGLLLGVLTSVGIVGVLVTLEPLLLPMALVAAIPVLAATLINSRQSYAFEYGMTTNARERLFLFELFADRDAAKELRIFGAGPYLRRRYDALSDERVRKVRAFVSGRLKVSLLGNFGGALAAAAAIGSLIVLLAADKIGVASAATAAVGLQVLSGRLTTVTSSIGKLIESSMFLNDLRQFLGEQHAVATRKATRHPSAAPLETLTVRDLSFRYPGTQRLALSGVSLDVKKGEVVALVGENGSGKTTLIKLLCRLYDEYEGTLSWNGADFRALDERSLQDHLTVLFQDFVRYHLSVTDNVVLGRAERPYDAREVADATRRAGAQPLVDALPSGFETRLGRQFLGGYELSGGQWQRLALARAFYRGGDVLVMDEPTAALDPRAEYELFQQLRQLAADKTVLLISHRFANVRMADRIYVLDQGRVVESGDHAALMASDGLYAELYEMQAASYHASS